jgi:para-nitrobenzyl esterase
MDEDCLRLNVWSPPGADRLPVLVWIHGGGYFVGSSSMPVSSGRNLAANGPAVVVSIAYRLGYRGFLDLSMLEGSAGRFRTNLGLRDQIAALSWVQDNIAEFGGDPDRVTIFGQSAGGGSVCCLLASPLARGLFGAAIAQSPPASSVFDRDRAATVSRRFLEIIDRPSATFDDIFDVDPSTLLDASGQLVDEMTSVFPGHHAFQPVVDSEVLLDTPIRSIAAGHGSQVPLIIGGNQDEGSLFVGPPMPPLIPTSEAGVRVLLQQDHPAVLDRVLAAYQGHGRWGAEIAVGGDGMVTMPATAIAEAMSQLAAVYLYRFRWTNEDLIAKRLGTPHTLDVPFVFGNLQEYALTNLESPDGSSARSVSEVIQSAWLAFARDHKPAVPGLTWKQYDTADRHILIIDRTLTVERDPDADQRKAWGV